MMEISVDRRGGTAYSRSEDAPQLRVATEVGPTTEKTEDSSNLIEPIDVDPSNRASSEIQNTGSDRCLDHQESCFETPGS